MISFKLNEFCFKVAIFRTAKNYNAYRGSDSDNYAPFSSISRWVKEFQTYFIGYIWKVKASIKMTTKANVLLFQLIFSLVHVLFMHFLFTRSWSWCASSIRIQTIMRIRMQNTAKTLQKVFHYSICQINNNNKIT